MRFSLPIAIYFDLENIDKNFNLSKLMESVVLEANSDGNRDENAISPLIAIKLACGETNSIAKFRSQLTDMNFEIREVPHVVQKKNRSDLVLSLEAFESLYKKQPNIDLYVFITSDTDFTIIMDKLRKYGKNVWLVTRNEDTEKPVFTSCSDKIFAIENYFEENSQKDNKALLDLVSGNGFKKNESQKIADVLESFDKDVWVLSSGFGTKLHSIAKDFSYKGKKINSQGKLFELLKEHKYIETKKTANQDYFKVIK